MHPEDQQEIQRLRDRIHKLEAHIALVLEILQSIDHQAPNSGSENPEEIAEDSVWIKAKQSVKTVPHP